MAQFVTAFDDIVIKRYNVNRKVEDRISVRYVYSPKQRVLYDIINTGQNMTLPAVAVTINSITRDNNRVFNKLDGFLYSTGSNKKSAVLRAPVPININVSMSIITRFQTDMDQILSNFVPYTNPYIIISWKNPSELGLPTTQEIRCEVLWDDNIVITYPTDLNGETKPRVVADTSFVIKGWLFKETLPAINNIYYIENNFYAENDITSYNEMSGNTYTYPASTGLYSESETVGVSGAPTVTNIYYNSVLVDKDLSLTPGITGTVLLVGTSFTNIDGILLSSFDTTMFSSLTTIDIAWWGGHDPEQITGHLITDFKVVNDAVLTFNLPPLYPSPLSAYTELIFVPFDKAGYATTTDTYNV